MGRMKTNLTNLSRGLIKGIQHFFFLFNFNYTDKFLPFFVLLITFN